MTMTNTRTISLTIQEFSSIQSRTFGTPSRQKLNPERGSP